MGRSGRAALSAAVGAALALTVVGAVAAASLSLAGDIRLEGRRTLAVPITATCEDVGQTTTFIVVTVTQGTPGEQGYVEGEGDVLEVTCDGTAQTYVVEVPVTFGSGTWKAREATVSAIISDCHEEGGVLNCVTQAFIPPTSVTLVRGR